MISISMTSSISAVYNRSASFSVRFSSYRLMATQTAMPYRSTFGIESIALMNAPMPTTIAIINGRIAVVEISYCIMSVDGEMPTASTPVNGADEVICCQHQVVLPVVKDMT